MVLEVPIFYTICLLSSSYELGSRTGTHLGVLPRSAETEWNTL